MTSLTCNTERCGEVIAIPETSVSADEFECSLCFRLLWQPVSTPCGHTFCRTCLNRSLDHTPFCPLCKASLKKVRSFHSMSYFILLDEYSEISISYPWTLRSPDIFIVVLLIVVNIYWTSFCYLTHNCLNSTWQLAASSPVTSWTVWCSGCSPAAMQPEGSRHRQSWSS